MQTQLVSPPDSSIGPARDALRVLISGHFAHGSIGADGQTAKTRSVTEELCRALPQVAIRSLDTGVSRSHLPLLYVRLWRELLRTDVVVALPGLRAVTWLLPQYAAWRRYRPGQLNIVAIGGWLAKLAKTSPAITRNLHVCDGIFVESQQMVRDFEALGLYNAHYLPNARRFGSARKPTHTATGPLRAVYLSRVIPSKGVSVAVHAALSANRSRSGCCTLDIYGPIGPSDKGWFASLERHFDSSIRYRGVVPLTEVQTVLREYEVFMFPTTYPGEGFAGVLVEAMIAGLAILASDWLSNAEVVHEGMNGFVLSPRDADAFATRLLQLDADRRLLLRLQQQSAQDARLYHPDTVMPILANRIFCC